MNLPDPWVGEIHLYDGAGPVNRGQMMLLDSSNGNILATYNGVTAEDQLGYLGASVSAAGHLIVPSYYYDANAVVNSGMVLFLNKSTGAIEAQVSGTTADDQMINFQKLSNGDYLFYSGTSDRDGITNSGGYVIVPMD